MHHGTSFFHWTVWKRLMHRNSKGTTTQTLSTRKQVNQQPVVLIHIQKDTGLEWTVLGPPGNRLSTISSEAIRLFSPAMVSLLRFTQTSARAKRNAFGQNTPTVCRWFAKRPIVAISPTLTRRNTWSLRIWQSASSTMSFANELSSPRKRHFSCFALIQSRRTQLWWVLFMRSKKMRTGSSTFNTAENLHLATKSNLTITCMESSTQKYNTQGSISDRTAMESLLSRWINKRVWGLVKNWTQQINGNSWTRRARFLCKIVTDIACEKVKWLIIDMWLC